MEGAFVISFVTCHCRCIGFTYHLFTKSVRVFSTRDSGSASLDSLIAQYSKGQDFERSHLVQKGPPSLGHYQSPLQALKEPKQVLTFLGLKKIP